MHKEMRARSLERVEGALVAEPKPEPEADSQEAFRSRIFRRDEGCTKL